MSSESVKAKMIGEVIITLKRKDKNTFILEDKEYKVFIGDTLTIYAPFETRTKGWEDEL